MGGGAMAHAAPRGDDKPFTREELSLSIRQSARPALNPAALPPGDVEALYVHVPFCFHKCHYCDFYSITRQTPERMSRFVDLLLSEAQLWTPLEARPTTIFFGGGTPSLLPLELMRKLIHGLKKCFDL